MLFPACLMTPTASSTFLGVLPLMVTSLSFSRTPNLAACPDKSRNKEKLRWTHWDKPIAQQQQLKRCLVVVKNMVERTHMMTEVSMEKMLSTIVTSPSFLKNLCEKCGISFPVEFAVAKTATPQMWNMSPTFLDVWKKLELKTTVRSWYRFW